MVGVTEVAECLFLGGRAGGPRFRKHMGSKSPDGYLIKALERIGIFADQQYQGGGLRVGFGSTLFPVSRFSGKGNYSAGLQ